MALRANTTLFLDDVAIAQQRGLRRLFVPATKYPKNPIIRRDNPWEAAAVYIFGSVLREPETGLLRMWYQAIDDNATTACDHMTICHAESQDGIHWHKPLMSLVPYRDLKLTNIVLGNAVYPGNAYCCSVILEPEASEPGERYKMMVWYEQWSDKRSPFNGAACFHSEDGLRWRVYPEAQPAIGINVHVEDGRVMRFESPNDANCLSPDRLDGEFVNWQVMRRNIAPTKTVYSRDLMASDRLERVLAMQTSPDFVHWSEPRDIITPGPDDPDFVQFYGMGGFRYGNYWLGTLWMYYVHDQAMDVELALSRDGRHWSRPFPGQRLISLGNSDTFDRGMMQTAVAPVIVGNQIYIYYGGENHRHDESGVGAIGLATLPLDRWAGLQTGQRGLLQTQPFTFLGSALELNAYAVGGEVLSEILDEDGRVISGFELAQSQPVIDDQLAARLRWQGNSDLRALRNRKIALRFHLLNASVYAFTQAD